MRKEKQVPLTSQLRNWSKLKTRYIRTLTLVLTAPQIESTEDKQREVMSRQTLGRLHPHGAVCLLCRSKYQTNEVMLPVPRKDAK